VLKHWKKWSTSLSIR